MSLGLPFFFFLSWNWDCQRSRVLYSVLFFAMPCCLLTYIVWFAGYCVLALKQRRLESGWKLPATCGKKTAGLLSHLDVVPSICWIPLVWSRLDISAEDMLLESKSNSSYRDWYVDRCQLSVPGTNTVWGGATQGIPRRKFTHRMPWVFNQFFWP